MRRFVGWIFNPSDNNESRLGRIGNPSYVAAVLLVGCSITTAATPQGARNAISADDLRHHVTFLASDTLEGRAAGSQGGRAAAAYLAQQLREAGLQPGADDDDFLQPFNAESQNLLAVVPGSDPELKSEVIIVSGHFDHVGLGSRSNSFGPYGQIHNGADDNASGTAAVLEVAKAMASLDQPPRRTVLFALWDAEERGMIGSSYWIKHSTVDLKDVRLMVNCDMVGRLRNDVLVVYGVRSAAGLRQRLAEANEMSDLTLNLDWRQRDDSDHWPFYKQGIPYLMLHTGDHLDYHRPSDDADKVNFDGLETISRLLFDFTRQVANADSSLTFRDKAREERRWHQQQAEAVPAQPASRLGIRWDNSRAAGDPFTVTHVDSASAAARAGLRVDDRITHIAGQPALDAENLVDVVLAAPQQTTVTIKRTGHTEEPWAVSLPAKWVVAMRAEALPSRSTQSPPPLLSE